MLHYLFPLLFSLAACFAIQSWVFDVIGHRVTKSESNYFSSLARVQAGARVNPEVMILGSSMTGRLPDQRHGYLGIANLGTDGGCAMDVLRAMDRGDLPVPTVLLIEANTLKLALQTGETEIAAALRRPWFRAGLKFSALSSARRPSSVAYSLLLAGRSAVSAFPGRDLGVSTQPAIPENFPTQDISFTSPREREIADELIGIVSRLHTKSTRIVFVMLPPTQENEPLEDWIRAVISQSGAEWWDIAAAADPAMVKLTDRVHMTGESAARTTVTILRGLNRYQEPIGSGEN